MSIQVIKTFTADTSDALAGTELENIPGPGQLDIFVVSTADDTYFTVHLPGGETPVRNQLAQKKTDAQISLTDDIPVNLATPGGRVVIEIDINTAATVKLLVNYTDLEELAEIMGAA